MAPTDRVRLAAMVLVLGAATASCSSGGGGGSEAAGNSVKTAKLYVIAPQTGSNSHLGLGVRNGVTLAVNQANDRREIPGWKLQVEVLDDKADKAVGAENAKRAATDGDAAAVIGSVFSGVTKAILPDLAAAGMPTVGPSPTNPALTKGDAYASSPARPFANFFRVIAPDDAHGPALAKYLAEKGANTVATAHDGDLYGIGLVAAFTAGFPGRAVDIGQVSTSDHNYSGLVERIRSSGAQAVLFGGNSPEAGPLSLQLKKAGIVIPVVGGDSLATNEYIPMAGPVSAGDLSTKAGHPIEQVEEGKTFLKDYSNAEFAEPVNGFSALGYDAARAAILALKESLPAAATAKDARAATVKALSGVRFPGTGGPVAFDGFGDITPRVVTVMSVQGGAWKSVKTYTF
ncbi:amino acid/amide ABC transporter substrate-binding protein, HAAT family [Austwickia chelonae]|uniref:Putative ABC transporter substrate-binding protein n=1 Tax=Austwickia chelonae NBRC 105200 TaxID=1184607 RepID=K6UNF1_9MICO|nr:branched-chain amino acid ABC transporter substrate-binding protein [Austwickia chelonae]GAB78926.1 putative ABC transporter substrate-binding protein [Austwickia chelonae NBRC 105200]SEV86695.1 amino acid/amide ABC transporter substrate-binding protein, HAAT family [Austwickia chelonae]